MVSLLSVIEGTPARPGIWRRFGFRLLSAYVLFYLLSLFAAGLWEPLVVWAGRHLFRTDVTPVVTGSGDTAFDYVLALCRTVLALLAASAWTALDRRRVGDARLGEWMRIAVRFALALTMVQYGAIKIIPAQFPIPSLSALAEPLGDHSPMGLLWAFMGTSPAYNVFAGTAEAIGGLLLLSRRTTLLGALLCMVAMGNVVALNFCYDVPVKLFSLHLLAMAALLAAPDAARLAGLFLWNRSAPPAALRPHSSRRWINRTLLGVKIVLFLGAVGAFLYGAVSARQSLAPSSGTRPPLYGVWNVDAPVQDGLTPDAARWRQAVFEYPGAVGVQTADGAYRFYRLSVNRVRGTLTLTTPRDKAWASHLVYIPVRPGRITLRGEFNGLQLQATLTRAPEVKPPLLSRGFHWISAVPFNR